MTDAYDADAEDWPSFGDATSSEDTRPQTSTQRRESEETFIIFTAETTYPPTRQERNLPRVPVEALYSFIPVSDSDILSNTPSNLSQQSIVTMSQGSLTGTNVQTRSSEVTFGTTRRSDEEVLECELKLSKYDRGTDSKVLLRNRSIATAPLTDKFTAPTHSMLLAEADAEGVKDDSLQDVIVKSSQRVRKVYQRCAEFDFLSVLQIQKVTSAPGAALALDSEKADLLSKYQTIPFSDCRAWNSAISRYGAAEDRQSNSWALDFFRDSSTEHLQVKVNEKFDKLDSDEKGGVTYFSLMMSIIMDMTDEVAQQAKEIINTFSLRKIPGENVSHAKQRIMAVASILDQAGMLTEDHYDAVMKGLTECSLPAFVRMFQTLKSLKAQDIYDTHAAIQSKTILQKIEHLFEMGEREYSKLCHSNGWPAKDNTASSFNASGGGAGGSCWNCGGSGHLLPECSQDKDQTRIDANRKKFFENMRQNRGNNTGRGARGGGRGGGRGRGAGRGNAGRTTSGYTATGHFEKPTPYEKVRMINGAFMFPCSKGCGWNTTHSSSNHKNWSSSPNSFRMPPTYPGAHLVSAEIAPAAAGTVTTVTPSSVALTAAHLEGRRAAITEIEANATSLGRTTSDPGQAAIFGTIASMMTSAMQGKP